MASNERVRKVSEQIRRELVAILPECVYHKDISLVSVTGIDLSRDFKFAKIYITLVGNADERTQIVELLNEKSANIRHLLSKQLMTRTVPAMTFVYDESIEYGAKMESLLTKLTKDIKDDLIDEAEDDDTK